MFYLHAHLFLVPMEARRRDWISSSQLQLVVNHHISTLKVKPWSSGRTTSTINHWAILKQESACFKAKQKTTNKTANP